MSKGMQLRSRSTGLIYTIHEINGDRIMVRDESGKVINHYFDKDAFLKGD